MSANAQLLTSRKVLHKKRSAAEIAVKTVFIIFLALLALAIVMPLLFVVSTSFKDYAQYITDPFGLSFSHPENYVKAWTTGNLGTYFMNSLIICVCTLVCGSFNMAIGSFAIGRLRFKGSGVMMSILLSTMFITGELTSIPMFILLRQIGLFNTRWAVVFTGCIAPQGFGILLGSNSLKGFPAEIHEAAILDGAGIWDQFAKIDLPFLRPAILYTAVGIFQGCWGDYMWPMIVIPSNRAHWTLAVGIVRQFADGNSAEFGIQCAGLLIIMVPILILYICFSKYFTEGIAVGAVKG